jgi:hypothetical protein
MTDGGGLVAAAPVSSYYEFTVFTVQVRYVTLHYLPIGFHWSLELFFEKNVIFQ